MNIESLLFIREKMSIHLLDLDYVSPRRKIEVVGMEKRMVEEDMLWLQSTIFAWPTDNDEREHTQQYGCGNSYRFIFSYVFYLSKHR